ncbi:MAG: TonB-dependent receptor domain-containing protein, partial [Nitrospiraceae bacterium]
SVGVTQSPTINQIPSGPPVRNLSYTEQGWGQYVQAQIQPFQWLKFTGGSRYDHFWYDIDDHLSTSSVPKANTGVFSPKAGVAVTPASWVEVFGNYGEGFRSPSAVDTVVITPNVKPIKLRSYEVGFLLQPVARFTFRAAVWSTTLNQEVFQAAAGLDPQNLGKSRREGYDIETRYYVRQDRQGQASVFVNYSQIRAKLVDESPAVVVPNVPVYLINVGSDVDIPVGGLDSPHRVGGQLYVQFIGKKNLSEDGLLTTSPYQRIASRFFYAHQSGWTGFTDLIWYPSDRLSETAINFGNPTGASAADIFVNPQAPLTLQVGLSYRFKT